MEPEKTLSLHVEDFDSSEFDNPIKLLDALNKKRAANNCYSSKLNISDNPLFCSFMSEIQNMKISYSYKPIFLLAILDTANDFGVSSITDIVNYFMNFYLNRWKSGLVVEKKDSTFLRAPNDRLNAKNTIVTYPIAVFVKKGFIKYHKKDGIVSVSQSLWEALTPEICNKVIILCENHIKLYYSKL